jgi:hypothetical protein
MLRIVVIGVFLSTAACRDSPSHPDPLSAFQVWRGPVTFVRHTTQGPLNDTVTWHGDVTWEKDFDPDPAPLVAGTSVYVVLSGEMKVTHSLRLGPCSAQRETTHRLKPDHGFLVVDLAGAYTGYLRAKATFPTTASCTSAGTVVLGEDVASMDLEMKGQVADGVLKGEMPVQAVAATTFRGQWDFTLVFR